MRCGALVLAFVCGAAGCAQPAQTVQSISWLDRLRASGFGKDVVQIDVALLERPIGDPFVDRELWKFTDEQSVPLDQKAVLDDNGFRVGQIVGMAPGKLLALLRSERSCINPRRQFLPPGRPTVQVLGPTVPQVEFQVTENGRNAAIVLEQAQFVLEVVASLTKDGRTRLRFTPKVQYGEKVPELHPAPDGSDWMFELSRPSKNFPGLAWEVAIAPNEFLVVGANSAQPDSLGGHAFIQNDDTAQVQRLLVIRTNRPAGAPTATLEDLARHSPPLAEQAAAVRALGQ